MDRGAWQATVHGMARVGYNLALFFLYQLSYQGSQLPTSVAFFLYISRLNISISRFVLPVSYLNFFPVVAEYRKISKLFTK